MPHSTRAARLAALAALTAATLLSGPQAADAGTTTDRTPSAVGSICYSRLPSQAHDTLDLIDKGGPFPYPKDGTVFDNREGLLPVEPRGYYHEYTVITPGAPDRGARRIVTGERHHEDYYTADHYASFGLVDLTC